MYSLAAGGIADLSRVGRAYGRQSVVATGALDGAQPVRVQERTAPIVGLQVEFAVTCAVMIPFPLAAHSLLQPLPQSGRRVQAAQAQIVLFVKCDIPIRAAAVPAVLGQTVEILIENPDQRGADGQFDLFIIHKTCSETL